MDDWRAFRRAGEAGRLKVRLMGYMNAPEAAGGEVPRQRHGCTATACALVGVKLFADGALGSRGAWLKQPYSDKPDTRGLPLHSDAEYLAMADARRRARLPDRDPRHRRCRQCAGHLGLRATVERKYPGDRRWRIEHFQIADPADIPRLAPAGIIASMQPTHQTSDRLMAEKRLGPNRLAGAYAWQSVLKIRRATRFRYRLSGRIAQPLPRPRRGDQPAGHAGPAAGRLDSERAADLRAGARRPITRGAAYAGFAEDRIGALEPGKWADFIIVDRDPTKVDAQALARTQVLETWVAGKKVWARAPNAAARRLAPRAREMSIRRRQRSAGNSSGSACPAHTTGRAARRRGRGFRGSG